MTSSTIETYPAATEDCWTASELAARRGCTIKNLRKLRNERGLPAEPTGPDPDDFRYPRAAVATWEDTCVYWSSAEVCTYLGVSAQRLKTLRETRGLPHVEQANGFCYWISSVKAWDENRQITIDSSQLPSSRPPRPQPPRQVGGSAGRSYDRRGPNAKQGRSGPRPLSRSV